jgi:hypothetical protein
MPKWCLFFALFPYFDKTGWRRSSAAPSGMTAAGLIRPEFRNRRQNHLEHLPWHGDANIAAGWRRRPGRLSVPDDV